MYAIRQHRDGRRVGNRLNVRDVSSVYAQQHKSFTVERLDHFDTEENQWKEAVVEDIREQEKNDQKIDQQKLF